MKKVIKISFFLIAILLLSCGRWSDNIKLSTRSAVFSGLGDSIVVTTKGTSWWICEIKIDDSVFYDFHSIDVLADSYLIKHDCVTFQRLNRSTMFIKLDPNPLPVDRIVIIGLEAGDYFDRVAITQKPH
jgi:hypothetical protein